MVNRRVLHISPKFLVRLKQIQGKIKAQKGIEPSLTKLADDIISTTAFEEVEKQIVNGNSGVNINFKMRFDKR